MVASVGIVLAGLVAAAVLPNLLFGGYEPAPGVSPSALPAPPASAPPRATTGPSASAAPTMPAKAADVLRSNPIYALPVRADCPGQSRPDGRAAFRRQVRGLMDCVNAAWRTALAGTAVTFAKPKVKFYDTRASSPCGRLGTAFPAAYCSANQTLYFSIASFEQGRYYRLAVAHFVLHEYAHHVQELAGILGARWALDESAAVTTRRVELQAHCLAHYHLTHSNLGFDSLDRADAEYQFSWTSDPGGHGSVKAERFWGRRGLDGSSVGACNTWKARPSRVK